MVCSWLILLFHIIMMKKRNILHVLMGLMFFVSDMNHVIEIYDFPTEFKTEDLLSVFSQFK